MKKRKLIGTSTLDKAIAKYNDHIPIASIVKVLNLDMHYRTAFNIIKADLDGLYNVTRPEWLVESPSVQTAPDGWVLLNGMTSKGKWILF